MKVKENPIDEREYKKKLGTSEKAIKEFGIMDIRAKNPHEPETKEWSEWERWENDFKTHIKLFKDMTKYISEKILSVKGVKWLSESQFEVRIRLNDLAKEYEVAYLDIDKKDFFEWRKR